MAVDGACLDLLVSRRSQPFENNLLKLENLENVFGFVHRQYKSLDRVLM
tara:strand:+ start:217 stop:363 length:147 start_codon:yes stop_codon:yes gene_type:complete